MNSHAKKHIVIIVVAVAVIAAVAAYILTKAGIPELTQFNSASMMDWALGGEIVGIASVEDARSYDPEHFEFFTDDNGCGLKSLSSNTRYYLDDISGKCRVVGFSTTEKVYSVMGVRTGDDELDAKTSLLDDGYSLNGGGLDSCRASNGRISVYLSFEHGVVTGVAAFFK